MDKNSATQGGNLYIVDTTVLYVNNTFFNSNEGGSTGDRSAKQFTFAASARNLHCGHACHHDFIVKAFPLGGVLFGFGATISHFNNCTFLTNRAQVCSLSLTHTHTHTHTYI